MIRITGHSLELAAPLSERARLRAEFGRCCRLRLPGLIEEGLLQRLQARAATAPYSSRNLAALGRQQVAGDPVLDRIGLMVMNREPLFRFIEEVTRLSPVRGFDGAVYRLEPDSGQELDWHEDHNGPGRVLGISINLGERACDGGVFQLRERRSGNLLGEIASRRPGDAVLFAVAPTLEHRVTPVTGSAPRIALAGRFLDHPQRAFSRRKSAASDP